MKFEIWNLKVPENLKKNQICNLMKIRQVGDELFHADRQTDMIKLTVAFRNSATVRKNSTFLPEYVCSARISA
jgi:hypothetical protein